MIKLDLTKFKHLKSDDNSTTLQHRDGHVLTIAHKSLAPDAQKQLSALSGIAKQAVTREQSDESAHKMALGGATNVSNSGNLGSAPLNSMQQTEADAKAIVQKRHQNAGDAAYSAGDLDTAKHEYSSLASGNNMAKGGKVQHYADGTDQGPIPGVDTSASPTQMTSQDPQAAVKEDLARQPDQDRRTEPVKRVQQIYNTLAPQDQFGPHGEAPQHFDPTYGRGAEHMYTQEQSNAADQAAVAQQKIAKENPTRIAAGLEPLPQQPIPTQPAPPGSDANPQDQNVQQPPGSQPDMNQDPLAGYAGALTKGFNMQEAANTGIGQEQARLGARNVTAQEKTLQDQQAVQKNYQDTYTQLEAERQKAVNDIKAGYIDPDKYWKGDPVTGEGGHSKIAAGIGMILAGFNPTNNPNAAINFLKYQMDNSMQAQAKNLQSKDNILAHNIAQFGNLRDAANFHRVMNLEMLQNQLGIAAAQSQGPMAKLNAQNANGMLEREKAPLMMGLAMNATMGRLAQQANAGQGTGAYEQGLAMMKRTGSPQAKVYDDAYIPGIGVSKGLTPIPDDVKKQAIAYKNANDVMNMSLDFSRQYGGKNAVSLMADPVKKAQIMGQAKVIQSQLIGQIKQAQHDGVYKPSEAEYLLGQVGGSPDSFLANLSSVPKMEELQKIKQTEYSNLLNTYGIHNQTLPQQQAQPQYKMSGGKKYMRGPDGKAIEVK